MAAHTCKWCCPCELPFLCGVCACRQELSGSGTAHGVALLGSTASAHASSLFVDRVDCMQQLPERTCLDPTLLFVPGIESKQAVAYVHSAALRVRRKYRAVLTCLPVYCMVSNARWQKFQSNAA
eukprot:scaffold105786_cov25-Tisochrysis_lutea.AAC.1